MAIPNNRQAFQDFVRDINATQSLIENESGRIIWVPALEVVYMGEGGQIQQPQEEMKWRFVNWTSQDEFIIQLEFREPRLVSTNPIYDELEIRIWNPLPFTAKGD